MRDYGYSNSEPTWANAYLWPEVKEQIARHRFKDKRGLDLGCGNGATCGMLASLGFDVTGVDTSASGIGIAREAFPSCSFEVASAYDPLAARLGTFPLVISLEVIEHCVDPRAFTKTFRDLLAPDGLGILSTPYHGYLKNLALAATGEMDRHLSALWDGGHVKFFSIPTLRTLLTEAGFAQITFLRVGRIPPLAKSMIAVFTR
jgi:2-polyprenyl-3-methyl-5-hydroxy-6-metoxy-1,4-benzoquinol methylase